MTLLINYGKYCAKKSGQIVHFRLPKLLDSKAKIHTESDTHRLETLQTDRQPDQWMDRVIGRKTKALNSQWKSQT